MTTKFDTMIFGGLDQYRQIHEFCKRDNVIPISISPIGNRGNMMLIYKIDEPFGAYLGKVPTFETPKTNEEIIDNLKKEFYKQRSKILTHLLDGKDYASISTSDLKSYRDKLAVILEQLKKAGVEMTL